MCNTIKSKKNLGLLKFYTCKFTKPESFICLFNSIVKSSLMFASIIWESDVKYVNYEIEKVQNIFLRYESFKLNSPMNYNEHDYTNIRQRLNLLSLSNSRKFQNLIFLYKLFNNKIDSPELISLFNLYVPTRRVRNNNYIFFIPKNYFFISSKSIVFKLSSLANSSYTFFDLFHPSFSYVTRLIRSNINNIS